MITDIHCHLESVAPESLAAFIAAGNKIGAVSMTLESAQQLITLKQQYPDAIALFLGVHPEVSADETMIEAMIALIHQHHGLLSGIGEIGIPFFYLDDKTVIEKQQLKQQGAQLMARFVALAAEYNLPVNLHVVEDDIELALPILQQYGIEGALFHWYEGSAIQLAQLHQCGHFISASPWIFVDDHYWQFVQTIPLSMLLVESDAPCKYNGEKGDPSMTVNVVAALAKHHQISIEQLTNILAANTCHYLRKSL
ncbi:TatD family hydrolase [Photobacterium aquimaris]|uniref:TatD family deoxyribonuclease n=1 Tax=Photobacterium aquimaris TaxID=512643 RepID=A0A2T3HZS2_9GAMM|nr:TatD family hydrolase [Photobacterium aquimaris]OBU25128.1 translocase [Photobacterium aquimaris]PQJ38841.1 translocase [Photobacterium aquimaris]PSU07661.1 TatD family deoxyribonuclease [Photobacterium aquimaris]